MWEGHDTKDQVLANNCCHLARQANHLVICLPSIKDFSINVTLLYFSARRLNFISIAILWSSNNTVAEQISLWPLVETT